MTNLISEPLKELGMDKHSFVRLHFAQNLVSIVHSLKEDMLINDFNQIVINLKKDKDEYIKSITKEQVDYLQQNKYNTELIEEYDKQDLYKEKREPVI